ncbi:MAG TPA: hypothetical protein VG870_01790 [Chitinophagaceae bacterium]|nr:hypothetical protein [Chitinophagaceae bacterium]
MPYTAVSHIGHEHQDWLRALSFYKDELAILDRRLREVAIKNTQSEAAQGVEHFQNQFLIQRNNIDELSHRIREHYDKITSEAKITAGHVEKELVREHQALRDDYTGLERLLQELRHDFNRFLSKWL